MFSPSRALPLQHAVEPPSTPLAIAPRPSIDAASAEWDGTELEETGLVKSGLLSRAVAAVGAIEAAAGVAGLLGGRSRRVASGGAATRLALAATLLVAAREQSWRAPVLSGLLLSRVVETAAVAGLPGEARAVSRVAAPLELAVLTGLWREALRAERWDRG
jgi:hypothetical protein